MTTVRCGHATVEVGRGHDGRARGEVGLHVADAKTGVTVWLDMAAAEAVEQALRIERQALRKEGYR